MSDLFTSKAQLFYYTKWIIADCDPGIMEYYSWLYWRRHGIKLLKPMHGSHISIVRGEEEGIDCGWWKSRMDGPMVEFSYSIEMREQETYVWLDVFSSELEEVRTDLGLSNTPPTFNFHLTLGRKHI